MRRSPEERLKSLAENLDRLAEIDEATKAREAEIAALRLRGAVDLHHRCSEFCAALSRLLRQSEALLDPPDYDPENFREAGPNLFQINVHGRLLMFEFAATDQLIDGDSFREPFILEGAVRCFNQDLLDHDVVEEHQLYYVLRRTNGVWCYFEPRTYRTGPIDTDYLISRMERLV